MRFLLNQIMIFVAVSVWGCSSRTEFKPDSDNVVYADSEFEIISEVVDSARDLNDVDIVRLWKREVETDRKHLLLQTVRNPEAKAWYLPDGKEFMPVPFDSVPVASSVKIWRSEPLQFILEGCPDMRNIHSFFVDVDSRKAWFVPSNNGFLGETEEGFMIFHSYRYVSNMDIGGRYSFIQIFNEQGIMVDSLNLEKYHYPY